LPSLEARTTRRQIYVAEHRILREALRCEVKRTILRESQDRYLHEMMDDEERMVLLGRARKLRHELGLRPIGKG
jgi:hypothetical protein